MKERVGKLEETRTWRGSLPVEHVYTFGLAGEDFFRALKDRKKIYGSRCPSCRSLYLPPKLYCERCFVEMPKGNWEEIKGPGEVASFTILHRDANGAPLENPVPIAFIAFPGVLGGIIHRLGEVPLAEISIGMRVHPVFEDRRKGGVHDIRYFAPVGTKPRAGGKK